jgi:hypothetical protein
MKDFPHQELQGLLQGWCNHTLTETGTARLQEILLQNRKARVQFRRARNLNAALHECCEGEATLDLASPAPSFSPIDSMTAMLTDRCARRERSISGSSTWADLENST